MKAMRIIKDRELASLLLFAEILESQILDAEEKFHGKVMLQLGKHFEASTFTHMEEFRKKFSFNETSLEGAMKRVNSYYGKKVIYGSDHAYDFQFLPQTMWLCANGAKTVGKKTLAISPTRWTKLFWRNLATRITSCEKMNLHPLAYEDPTSISMWDDKICFYLNDIEIEALNLDPESEIELTDKSRWSSHVLNRVEPVIAITTLDEREHIRKTANNYIASKNLNIV